MEGHTRKTPVDQAARDRATGDLDVSFCMEAGAGTGKTSLLVGRYLSLVRSGRAGCRQIVAITFTEKAAAEMKSRLRRELREELEAEGAESETGRRLAAAVEEIEGAPVSTIHSFASSLLREYPVEARVDPGFGLLDGIEEAILTGRCWTRFVSSAAGAGEKLLEQWSMSGGTQDRLREIAMKIYSERGSRALSGMFGGADDAVPASHEVVAPAEGGFAALLEEEASRLERLASAAVIAPEDRGLEKIREFLASVEALRSVPGGMDGREALSIDIPSPAGNMKNWDPPQACRDQKALLRGLAAAQQEARSAATGDLRRGLEKWLEGFVDEAELTKKEQGVLDFDDLLIKARMLLDDNAVLGELRRRYRYFLVDEFQDTDPVQAEIVMLLAGEDDAGGERSGGRLFIVGDPKQSIYRFRKADIEIYEKVKRRFAASGRLLRISQNFRSVPGVTEWVNGVFRRIMEGSEGEYYQPGYEPVHPWRAGGGASVVLLGLEPESDRAEDIREAEARAVARSVAALADSGLEVMDPVSREKRPVRRGDMAVLYRSTTGIEHYEGAFRRAGIPYVVEGGKLYYTRQEVRDMAAASWAIEDPRDPMALVSCLRSGLFGFSDEELLELRSRGGRFDYLDPGLPRADLPADFEKAFTLLSSLHAGRNDAGPVSTLRRLLAETGYLESAILQPHGRQRVDNIIKAVDMARSFESGHRSFRRFAGWIRDQERLGAGEGESPLVEEDEDAVRMLTIHKSKGLQFPVVILVNLIQDPGRRRRSTFITRSGEAEFDLGGGWKTPGYEGILEDEKRRDLAETTRLLYVAATRAGDMLVIPGIEGCREGHYSIIASGLESLIESSGEASFPPSGGEPGRAFLFESGRLKAPERGDGSGGPRAGTKEVLSGISRRRAEREGAIESGSTALRSIAPSSLALHEEAVAAAGGIQEIPGDELGLRTGLAFHRVMESIDITRDAGEPEVEEALRRDGCAELTEEVVPLVMNALGSELAARARASERVLREVPFAVMVGAVERRDGSALLEGRVDLLFREGGGWVLVDLKSDRIESGREAERAARYRPQMMAYSLALERLGIRLSGGACILFARTGGVVRFEVDGLFIEEAERMVLSRAASAGG